MPFADKIKTIAARAVAALYPEDCPACGRPAETFVTAPFCEDCWRSIAPMSGPRCGVCSIPITSPYAHTCANCLATAPRFSRAMSYGHYDGPLMLAIHQLKFAGIRRLARPLGALMCSMEVPAAIDMIVPVPSDMRTLRERGFNQCALLAREVSRATGAPLVQGALYKQKETPPQVGLPRAKRLVNLRGAFAVRGSLKGRTVLLIDDIITTGATANECSKTMMKAGAAEVVVFTLARTGFGRSKGVTPSGAITAP